MSTQDVFVIRLSSGHKITLREQVGLRSGDILADIVKAHSVIGEVVRNPSEPTILGLKNLSDRTWLATLPMGGQRRVEPGKSVRLTGGTKIDFGSVTGQIQAETIPVTPVS